MACHARPRLPKRAYIVNCRLWISVSVHFLSHDDAIFIKAATATATTRRRPRPTAFTSSTNVLTCIHILRGIRYAKSMRGATKERLDALNEEIKALKKDGGGGVRSNSIIAAAVNNEDYDDGDKEAAMMEDPPGSTSSSVIDSVVNNGGARAVIHMGPTKTG